MRIEICIAKEKMTKMPTRCCGCVKGKINPTHQ